MGEGGHIRCECDYCEGLREQIAWTVERCNTAMGGGFAGTPNSAVAAVCDEIERLREALRQVTVVYSDGDERHRVMAAQMRTIAINALGKDL